MKTCPFTAGYTSIEQVSEAAKDIPGPLLRKPFGFEQLTESLQQVLVGVVEDPNTPPRDPYPHQQPGTKH
ncbi:MAG: hypothetical protein AAGA33_07440 [Pseudomonadota bacterium]